MRMVVTGRDGQIATALRALHGRDELEVVALGRPEFDLERVETLAEAVRAARPDVLISAAAYTAVDAAETDAIRARILNAVAPGVLAKAVAERGVPIIHLSTDYVFDGALDRPYREDDATAPVTVYGATKLAGEEAVSGANPRHAILRTAWVYAPWGKNFVRTMLRTALIRNEIDVVGDQRGCPSYAPDIAEGVVAVARRLYENHDAPTGVFHMAGAGEASWATFAEAIFNGSAARGGPRARVKPIATADYPTPARRPANSRLDGARLKATFGVESPGWPDALDRCLNVIDPSEFGVSS